MSENPTILQILQRLAVVAQDMVKIEPDSEIVYVYRRGAWRKATKIGQLDPDLIFGAACEKIESMGWRVSVHTGSVHSKYRAEIVVHNVIDQLYPANSDESITHATLLVLLAALEERVEAKSHNPDQAFHEQLGSFYERIEKEEGPDPTKTMYPSDMKGILPASNMVDTFVSMQQECGYCEEGVIVDYETGLNRPCPHCKPVARQEANLFTRLRKEEEALVQEDCTEYDGKGNLVTYFKNGDVQSVAGPCPACQGSSEKQEAKK